jgi:replicative DNA helicase
MTFKERISDGLEGKYSGLSNGLNRINKYIFGIQRSCYTLVGGASGSGKTTLVDYMLLEGIKDADSKNIPIYITYYSLEIDEFSKKANWLSVLIYQKYNIIVPPEVIKGYGDNRLDADQLILVEDVMPELEDIWGRITWIFETTNPTGAYKHAWTAMDAKGTFEKSDYVDNDGHAKKRIDRYIPNNPNEYNVIVVDHIALLQFERGFTLKENLDKMSEYFVRLRNLFGYTILALQQFNSSLSSVERQKFKGVDLSPQQSDFKDSTNMYQDCDIAIGLMNPYKMGMEECLGYNIKKSGTSNNLGKSFRMLKVIKNRLGADDVAIGLYFQPTAGRFEELPILSEMTPDKYKQYTL